MECSPFSKSQRGSALLITLAISAFVLLLGEALLQLIVHNSQLSSMKEAAAHRDRLVYQIARDVRAGPTVIKTMLTLPQNPVPMLVSCMNNGPGDNPSDCVGQDGSGNAITYRFPFYADDGTKITGTSPTDTVKYDMDGQPCAGTSADPCVFEAWAEASFKCQAGGTCAVADEMDVTVHVNPLIKTTPPLTEQTFVQFVPMAWQGEYYQGYIAWDYTQMQPVVTSGGAGGGSVPTTGTVQAPSCPSGMMPSGSGCISIAF